MVVHSGSTTVFQLPCAWQDIGADETIDYRSQDFAEVYADKPFDYIFDSVGGVPAICTHAVLVLHDAAI